MFNSYEYFFTFNVKRVEKDNSIPKHIIKKISRYLFWRRKKILYFEPFTNLEDNKTSIVIGSAEVNEKANRNVLIFILELYAALKNPSKISVTKDFPVKFINSKDFQISVYKIKRFKK